MNNMKTARDWRATDIKNKRIKMIVKAIINATEKHGVWIYHVSQFDSVYLKFKDSKMGSVRIADHLSKKTHLKYTWNISLDCGVPLTGHIEGNMNFYNPSNLRSFYNDLEERAENLNEKTFDFSNLRVDLPNKPHYINVEPKFIEESKTGEQGMKTKNIAAMLMDDCKTIGVKFAGGGNTYTYKTTEDFEVGEYVVVNTPRRHIEGKHSGLTIAIVTEVHKVPNIDVDSSINYQWIVQKVDMANYESLNQREDEFNDHLLEMQQKSVKSNAINMLADHLGVGLENLQLTVNKLNGKDDG